MFLGEVQATALSQTRIAGVSMPSFLSTSRHRVSELSLNSTLASHSTRKIQPLVSSSSFPLILHSLYRPLPIRLASLHTARYFSPAKACSPPSTRHHFLSQPKPFSRTAMSIAAVAASAAGGEPIKVMVVSDLDNTMVDHQDADSSRLRKFADTWQADYASHSLLVYSTGRSPTLYLKLKEEKPLLTPDIVICSVGTEICVGPDMAPDKGWEELLDQGWDRAAVVEEASKYDKLRPQSETEQRPHKVSFNIEKDAAAPIITELEAKLKERGVKAKIIYSGGYDLDILPEGAGKGRALEYLLRRLREERRHPQHTLVCGDSGNDIELYTVKDEGVHGVIVGNAMEELVSWHASQPKETSDHIFKATERCAAGILQALDHFKWRAA